MYPYQPNSVSIHQTCYVWPNHRSFSLKRALWRRKLQYEKSPSYTPVTPTDAVPPYRRWAMGLPEEEPYRRINGLHKEQESAFLAGMLRIFGPRWVEPKRYAES